MQLLPWMFLDYISAVPKKGAKDRQTRDQREKGAGHTPQIRALSLGGGPSSVLGVLSDRAVIVSRLKWVKLGLNSAAGPPRHHCAPPSTS